MTAEAKSMQHLSQVDACAGDVMRRSLMVVTCAWLCMGCDAQPLQKNLEPAPSGQGEATLPAIPAHLPSAVVDDVTRRTGTAREAVKILVAEAVTWSDGSLGCPEPGMIYTQALVRGYRIVASVDDRRFEYHAGTQGPPKFCPADRVAPPVADDRI
jgi:hypothetical protein